MLGEEKCGALVPARGELVSQKEISFGSDRRDRAETTAG